MSGQENIQQREHLARIAMREALQNQKAEDSVELFIQHHLEEIEHIWKNTQEQNYNITGIRFVSCGQ
jgi:predicted metalloprotease